MPHLKQRLRAIFCGIDHPTGPMADIMRIALPRPEGERHYLRAAPARPATGKRPLVIILHGAGSSAAQVLGLAFPPSPLSLWREIAERDDLVLIAPDGGRRRGERAWNDGYAGISANPSTDDTGFINAIIDRAIAGGDVDPERVYVIGVSKGGMMAYRLATELAPRLAAFAAVLASMPVDSAYGLPVTPLPALIVAGTADPFIPYAGGRWFYGWRAVSSMVAPMLGVEQTAGIWRALAGLPDKPLVTDVPHCIAGDATRVTRRTWGSDGAGMQVCLLTIHGGGHAEPSMSRRYPSLLSWFPGRQNADIEVAEEAWAFFRDKRAGHCPAAAPVCHENASAGGPAVGASLATGV